jgi:sodium-dependent dicarboxylate transporter 2/3/5
MILPILAALALDMKINPLFLMIPATLSASCAFMLPVATPPNAIVFGSGRVKIAEMSRAGIVINIVGAVFITLFFYLIATAIFSIDASVLPEWAKQMGSVKQ